MCTTRQSALQLHADMSYIFAPAWLDETHVSWHDCCWLQLAAALAAPGHPPDCPKSAHVNTQHGNFVGMQAWKSAWEWHICNGRVAPHS